MALLKRSRSSSSCALAAPKTLSSKVRRLSGQEDDRSDPTNQYFSELHPDLLELILSKLPFRDIFRFGAACMSWNRVAKTYSSSKYVPKAMLLLPSDKENDYDARVFFNVQDRGMYKIKNLGFRNGDRCIGSTGPWLVFLDYEGNVFLLNPFSRARIQLPPWNESLACLFRFRMANARAVLLSDPNTHDDKNFGVAVFGAAAPYNNCYRGLLVFYKNGKWNFPNPRPSPEYCDIIGHVNGVYAILMDRTIEVWDLQGALPVKKRVLQFSATTKMMKAKQDFDGLVFEKSYLVESAGDVLVVTRYRWYTVNNERQPVYEPEDGVITPYRTLTFLVHRVDFNEEKLVGMESLEDRILFLGGNYSLSLSAKDASGYERNSIYFTDDNWDQINEDYLYGGHDLGIFSLQDRSFKQIYEGDTGRIEPPPFWIFPTPLMFTPASSVVSSCP